MDILKGLNPQQQQAVLASTGPVLVIAGPGSGKTRVLTHRITYLVGSLGVRPYNILAVTFTNKAAKEMEARVASLLGYDPAEAAGRSFQGMPQLGTFHAICARLLRREAENLPFNANFVIYDADDQVTLVKQALADLNIDEKRYRAQGVHASISNAKNELVLPEAFPLQTYRDEVVKKVYQRYQERLLANNALDFDDLLLWTAFLLEQNPAVRDRYSRRFEHVLVDEFQDTNQAQYTLLKHLASFHRNIFVVGDTDQSIYAWRGADYRNLLRFEQDYPDAQVILLEQNYRSTQAILDVAMSVIDRNPQRKQKRLFTDRGSGRKVILRESYNDQEEAAFVVDTIAQLVRAGHGTGDFAIMYRTNAQSRVLEEAFLRRNLPYKLVGAQRFYGRREVKDAIAYLRLVHNPSDEVSLTRVINVPARGIGEKTLLTLRTLAVKAKTSMGDLLIDLARNESSPARQSFAGRALSSMINFGTLLAHWRSLAEQGSTLQVADQVLSDVDYHTYIDDGTDEGKDRWDNVMELRRLAAEFQERTLSEFLEEIALVSDQDTLEGGANVPTLLTLHAAKGLEFPVVFITGLTDGTLPHSRSFDDPDSMQEERRLFYVGITRAKDRLYLLFTQVRSTFGYNEPCDPSRFLEDIPNALLEETGSSQTVYRPDRSFDRASPSSYVWQNGKTSSPAASAPKTTRYSPGAKVIHPTWGEGMVLNSRIQDDEEIVDVFFESMGMKRVAASLAHLEIKK